MNSVIQMMMNSYCLYACPSSIYCVLFLCVNLMLMMMRIIFYNLTLYNSIFYLILILSFFLLFFQSCSMISSLINHYSTAQYRLIHLIYYFQVPAIHIFFSIIHKKSNLILNFVEINVLVHKNNLQVFQISSDNHVVTNNNYNSFFIFYDL